METLSWQTPPKVVTEESNIDRVKRQAAEAAKMGFAIQEPIFALGTPVISLGVENARLKRQEFEALPLAENALEQLRDRVRAEKRRDFQAKVEDLSLDPKTGRLRCRNSRRSGALFTDLGFRQMFGLLPNSPEAAGRYLASIPTDRRAREAREIFKNNSDRELVLRLRTPAGASEPQVYSVVSEKYADYGPIALSEDLLRLVKRSRLSETRAEIAYMGSWTTVKLITHSTVQPEKFVAGELFRAALAFKLSDDKRSSVRAWAETYRNLCLNLIVIDTARQGLMRRRHIGDTMDIGKELSLAAQTGLAKIEPFLAMWSAGRQIEVQDMEHAIKTLTRVEKESKVGAPIYVPNVEPAYLAGRIILAHAKEPERNLTGLVNAMTRAAHEAIWPDPLVAAENLQFQAGMLLKLDNKGFQRILES